MLGIPIENERFLINEFIRTILSEPNSKMYLFRSDYDYKIFCDNQGVEYKTQRWFKIAIFKDNIDGVYSYLVKNSLDFQSKYFPDGNPCLNYNYGFKLIKISPETKGIKPDYKDIISLIDTKKIEKLYHFTDKSNLESIVRTNGLYSWEYLERNRITINKRASSDLSRDIDRRKNLGNYVRLSFTKYHPMMHFALNSKLISDPIILEIDPTIMLKSETLFSDRNAVDRNAEIGNSSEFFKNFPFDILKKNYFELSEVYKSQFQSEILVKEYIGTDMILNIKELKSAYL